MSTPPLISIVTPIFNAQKFLHEAIQSVLAQTYEHWELLLVDDGSTDDSPAIAQQYAHEHPARIRYFEHKNHQNMGKSVSRNLAIQQAKGWYLAFLDADDVFLPHKLKHQVEILQSRNDDIMVYSPTRYWCSWTEKPQDLHRDHLQALGIRSGNSIFPPQLLRLYLNNPGSVPCTCALLVKTDAAKAINGFNESIQELYEDQVFLVKLCLYGSVYVDDKCCDLYRQHAESSSNAAIRAGRYHPYFPNPAHLAFLDWLGEYLKDKKIENPAVWQAYNRVYRPYRYPRLYRALWPVHYISPWINGWWAAVKSFLSRGNS